MGIDKSELYERLADHYLEFLQEHHSNLAEVQTEYENISALLEWIFKQADPGSKARRQLSRFCFYLAEYWRIRGKWKAAQTYVRTALEIAQADDDLLTQVRLLQILGQLGTELGAFTETRETFEQAFDLVETLLSKLPQDRETLETKARLLREFGRWVDNCVYELGKKPVLSGYEDQPPPEHYFEQSRRIWLGLGNEYQAARLLQNLGFRAMVNDDLQSAVSLQKQALAIGEKVESLELQGRCLHQMSRIASKLYDQLRGNAIAQEQAAEIRGQLDMLFPEAYQEDDLSRAEALLNRACAIAVELEDQRAESRTRREIGSLKITMAKEANSFASRQALLDQAAEELGRALDIAQTTGEKEGKKKIRAQLVRLEETRREIL